MFNLPKEAPFLDPSVVTELVSYLVKPEAHIVTGEFRFFIMLSPGYEAYEYDTGECINLNGLVCFD